MKRILIALVLSTLLTIPCVMHAKEIEIQLIEVIQMTLFPGNEPLDGPEQSGTNPTRPTDFRATINGNVLEINKLETAILSAQATVFNIQTGNIVVNQQFTTSFAIPIAAQGIYTLHIQTEGGALVGQFIIQ